MFSFNFTRTMVFNWVYAKFTIPTILLTFCGINETTAQGKYLPTSQLQLSFSFFVSLINWNICFRTLSPKCRMWVYCTVYICYTFVCWCILSAGTTDLLLCVIVIALWQIGRFCQRCNGDVLREWAGKLYYRSDFHCFLRVSTAF